MTTPAWGAVTVDAVDARALAEFWGRLLDRPWTALDGERAGWYQVAPTATGGPGLTVQPVPATSAVTARSPVHLDLWVDDLDDAAARVVALGGTVPDPLVVQHLDRGRVAVVADPEGHPFCLLAPPAGA